MSIGAMKKISIFSRDKGYCQYCGKNLSLSESSQWHIDHVVSKRNGGTNDPSNLKLSCSSCNSRKSGYSLEYFRGMMAINHSSYKGVINYKQALQLMRLGVSLNLPAFSFFFEGDSNER